MENNDQEDEKVESPKSKSLGKKLKGNPGAMSFKSETGNLVKLK